MTGGTAGRRVSAAVLVLVVGCTFSREVQVRRHELLRPLSAGLVNSFNVEEQLARGYVPEVLSFLGASDARSLDSTRFRRVLGQTLLERGDARGARAPLEKAHDEEGRMSARADIAWQLAQASWFAGDLDSSARWARTARSQGLGIPEGWLTFLRSARGRVPYAGAAPGERVVLPLLFGRPEIPRVSVRVNDGSGDAFVFDTGASMSLLTESTAARFGVRAVPDAVTGAYGLHRVEFPMRFGWAETVRLGALVLRDVPFGIVPDDALSFSTTHSGEFRFDGVLGVHLLREFDWRIEYGARRLLGVRLDPAGARGSEGQNLFLRRLKPMVRVSVDQQPWFLFLFDTGSEPTMLTRTGATRAKPGGSEPSYPITLEGIGKSRVSWGKVSNVTVGADGWMVLFRNLVLKEEADGLEEGVLGSSFLSRFNVEIRFGAMRLTLECPLDRLLEEEGAAPVPGRRIPGSGGG